MMNNMMSRPFGGSMFDDPFFNDPFFTGGGRSRGNDNLLQHQHGGSSHNTGGALQEHGERHSLFPGGGIFGGFDMDHAGSSSFVSSSYSYSSSGNGQQPVIKTSSSQTIRKGNVSETQKAFSDSSTGLEGASLRRNIGQRGREIQKVRERGGEEKQQQTLHHLSSDSDVAAFDEDWGQVSKDLQYGRRMSDGLSTRLNDFTATRTRGRLGHAPQHEAGPRIQYDQHDDDQSAPPPRAPAPVRRPSNNNAVVTELDENGSETPLHGSHDTVASKSAKTRHQKL